MATPEPAVPRPRKPRCHRHHVHLASCPDCQAEMHAERQAAAERLDQATR